nr:hypothetical protein [Tanacetum cinerariifolium]
MDHQYPIVAKIPILDTRKFEQWQFRIQQYLQHEHYALWEVIEFGDSYNVPANSDSVGSRSKDGRTITVTIDDMQKKKNDVKAMTTLLLSLPDEHQLRFSNYKTARELWAAILKTFGEIEKDDLNQKFLTSLAPEWLMHTIVWRNRNDLDSMSLDDLYNHLKVYEAEVQKKPNSNSQDMAFISSSKNSNNGDGNTLVMGVPPSPDYIPGPEAPPSPDYIPGPEAPPSPDYIPGPEYPDEGDNDADDDGDDLSEDDVDNEDEEESSDSEEEEEEHLALTVPAPAQYSSVSESDETEPFEEGETAATPPPFGYRIAARISIQPHILMPFRTESEVERLLAIPTPPLSPVSLTSYTLPPLLTPFPVYTPLLTSSFPLPSSIPSTSGSESIPEADIPLQKRACFTTPTSRYEIGESSVAAARQIRPTLTIAESRKADGKLIGRLRRERRYFRTVATTYAQEVAHSRDYCAWIMDYCQSREVHMSTLVTRMEALQRERRTTRLNPGTCARRPVQAARECSYSEFLKCKPLDFKGTEGVVELTQWFEKMKSVFSISNCTTSNQTTTSEEAYAMTWATLKKKMTGKYCPRGEIKKIETEMWNLKASRSKTMQEVIEFTTVLMEDKTRAYVERQADNKRKSKDIARNNQNQQPYKRQNTGQAYTAGNGDRRLYTRSRPLCPKCNYNHEGPCLPKCNNCKRVGHLTKDYRS